MHTVTRYTHVLFVIFFFFYTSSIAAQTRPSPYEVHNVLTDQKNVEHWTVTSLKNTGVYITTKTLQSKPATTTLEKSTSTWSWWMREVRPYNEELYYEEFLREAPYQLAPGESTFGYMNVRDVQTGELRESWPLFLSVSLWKGVHKATFVLYISGNRIMEISRIYTPQNFFFPLVEDSKIFKPGISPRDVPTIGVLSYFFERYVVTSRAQP